MPDFKLSYSSILEKQHAIGLKSHTHTHTYEWNRIEDPYVSTYSYRHCFLTKRLKILNKWCWSNWIIAHLEEWDWVLLSMQEWLHSREGSTPWWASQIGLERFFLKKLNFLVGVHVGFWRDWMRCWRRSKYFVRNSQQINKLSVKALSLSSSLLCGLQQQESFYPSQSMLLLLMMVWRYFLEEAVPHRAVNHHSGTNSAPC